MYLVFCPYVLSSKFLLCLHMMVAAMIKNPMLIRIITTTGTMKAQIKLVSGFRKQLRGKKIIIIIMNFDPKLTLCCNHSNPPSCVEQIPGARLEDPGKAGGYHS